MVTLSHLLYLLNGVYKQQSKNQDTFKKLDYFYNIKLPENIKHPFILIVSSIFWLS